MVGEVRHARREVGLRTRRSKLAFFPASGLEAADEDEARPEAGEERAQVHAHHHDDLKRGDT